MSSMLETLPRSPAPGRCAAVALLALVAPLAASGQAPAPGQGVQAPAGTQVAPAPAPAPAAAPGDVPADFAEDAKLLFRVVTCQGDTPILPSLDAKAVEVHCKRERKAVARYREGYLPVARRFLGRLRPAHLPPEVVYPFGGGDLLSALTTYPDARDYTTLSLEHAGDPRRLRRIESSETLAGSLEVVRMTASGLLYANDSKTENLMKGQRGEIPGQLAFFMLGLAVHGFEPVSLRFFRFEPDGTLHYLTQAEIAAEEQRTAKLLRGQWTAPDFSAAFSNSELVFVKQGEDPTTQGRVHRHVAADLSDAALKKQGAGLLRWLEAKGRIAAMTKAASYLLWRGDFSTVRHYLVTHMDFMISDSTGIPPDLLDRGFVQETYGRFEKSFLDASEAHNAALVKLWESQPARKLPIRYGYIDGEKNNHLLVTRRAPPAKVKM
jgi:hypothetical protein